MYHHQYLIKHNFKTTNEEPKMEKNQMELLIRILLCIIFPPLAVYDKGCGVIILVLILTLIGWLPGTIAALIFCLSGRKV